MRLILATLMFAGMALGLPLAAQGQSAPQPYSSDSRPAHAPLLLAGTDTERQLPVWRGAGGKTFTVVAASQNSSGGVPASAVVDARSAAASTGVRLNLSPSLYGRADVAQRNWLSDKACDPAQPGSRNSVCLHGSPLAASESGEVGAGYSDDGVKLDLSVGQSRTGGTDAPMAAAVNGASLPRVLPSGSGAAIAAPLLFPGSNATRLAARGQFRILPGTKLDVGASRGRVHFLAGAGLLGNDDLNQTTLSLGIEHGVVSGAIVGRMLEPALPGAALDGGERWSGIDLGVSVRLPWQGQLSFGAQNVWSSGQQPLLNPQDVGPDQARVPYVQYHQDL